MSFFGKRILVLLATILAQASFAVDVVAPAGQSRPTSTDDFMPHTILTDDFNETWSYQFVFDNGTRAFVNYTLMVVPGSGRKIGCDMTFWNFKGKTYTIGRQYPPERLKKDKASSTIDIKGEYMMQNKPGKGHRVLFSADKNGKYLLDVTFDSAEPGMVNGDGVWKIGKERFGQYIHIPYGRFSGKIAYNEDTLEVKGYAYMDQTWQTVQAIKIVGRTINFNPTAASPLYAGRINITPDGKTFGYAIHKNGNNTKTLTAKSITDAGKEYKGEKFPKGDLQFSWNEDAEPFGFPATKTYQKASILDKVEGWLAKKAFKIAAGEILFYRGKSTASNGKTMDWCITGGKD